MAANHQVLCVNIVNGRIAEIGGANDDKNRWRITVEAAIQGIREGKWNFYTHVNGVSAWVHIAKNAAGTEYLTTSPDGKQPNNLLNLGSCP